MSDWDSSGTPAHLRRESARLAYGAANRARLVRAETQLRRAEQGIRDIDAETAASMGRLLEVIAWAVRGETVR